MYVPTAKIDGFFGWKLKQLTQFYHKKTDTGTDTIYGLLGLKFLLKIPHKHTIDLCEHVVSCSSLE